MNAHSKRPEGRPASWGWLFALVLALAPISAQAQKVLVLELDGDSEGKLRSQLTEALKAAKSVQLASLGEYMALAREKGLSAREAMGTSGVAKLGPSLGLAAVLDGKIEQGFAVRILDGVGSELWAKKLPLAGGLLSSQHAAKLAKAVGTAAKVSSGKGGEGGEGAAQSSSGGNESSGGEATEFAGLDLSGGSAELQQPSGATNTGSITGADPERDPDLDLEGSRNRNLARPSRLVVSLFGTTTWRSYCSRPGVSSCQEYDLMAQPPPGVIVKFPAEVPYSGGAVGLELFPLATFPGAFRGVGLVGAYQRGYSLINVITATNSNGLQQSKQVVSTEDVIDASIAYRYFFAFNPRLADPGYVGVRGGGTMHNFEVDPTALVELPGTHRFYPSAGLDLAVPFWQWLRLEASGRFFFNPKAGVDEIAGYGDPNDPTGGATGQGFSAEAGLAGRIWGPVGYTLKFKAIRYTDRFFGQGQKWPCSSSYCGGAAEEAYSALQWGATAAF